MNFCDLQRFRRKTPVAAEVHADRFTVAKKNGTSAETYGEPQTPVNRFAVALSSELPEFSTAAHAAKRVIPHPTPLRGIFLRSIDFRLPVVRKRQVNARPHG